MNASKTISYDHKAISLEKVAKTPAIKEEEFMLTGEIRHNKKVVSITIDETRTYRLQLYKRILWQMLNSEVYLEHGYFDKGICGFINMCTEDTVKIKYLPELYRHRPWFTFLHPDCLWWKLNKKETASKRIKIVEDAIKLLQGTI